MTLATFLFILVVIGGSALLSWPLGAALRRLMDPETPDGATRLFQKVGGAVASGDQDWRRYLLAMLAFNAVSFTITFAILALQQHLPLNPDGKEALEGSLIFNTAASFMTNTNLQHYSGEAALSLENNKLAEERLLRAAAHPRHDPRPTLLRARLVTTLEPHTSTPELLTARR